MNENSSLKNTLQKFIRNQCSPSEIEEVIAYCKANNLTSDFPTVEEVQLLLAKMPQMENADADRIFANILSQAKETQPIVLETRKTNYRKYIAIAASLVIMLSVGIGFQQGIFNEEPKLILTGNEITLQLENGEIQVLSETNTAQVTDADGNVIGNQNGNKIVYDAKTGLEKLVYSTIKIPYGKRFELKLSDGTTVHLNSGTTLKYPVKFIAGQSRQVFLDGEAFFDVTKDKTHPFVVNADDLNIQVLGTHFNVTNYPEDDLTDVVLVEGSVGLYTANESFDAAKNTVLKPGFKGSFYKNDKSITTEPVVTEFYTAWIQGRLTFKNMTFKNIAKKLERHYDITIDIQNTKLANEKFNASFKGESLAKVLSYFSEIHAFNYTIKNKEISIN